MISSVFRFFYICFTLLRYGVDAQLNPATLPRYIRPLIYLLPGRYVFKKTTRGQRIHRALEQLGPVFIKLGQLLSTRPDLISQDIIEHLSLLQDQVKPLHPGTVTKILDRAYPSNAQQLFKHIDHSPLASASIAQVHAAILHNDEHVVLKILRPKIRSVISRDLRCLRFLAKLIQILHPDGYRIHPVRIVDDYQEIIYAELNLEHEAANTSLLGEHFQNSPDLSVPRVYWDYSNEHILCLQRVYAVPMNDIATLNSAGVDLKRLAERAVRIFFTQLLEHNFFHADMHPGNILIDISNPKDASFIALDCAIMGSLDEHEKITLAQLLNAIFSRDYPLAAKLFIRSGWVDTNTSTSALANTIRSHSEAVFSKPIEQVSFSAQLIALFAAGRKYNMHVQPSLVLLQKTLFNIEGLGKQLYPQLDLYTSAQPHIKKWLRQHYSIGNISRHIRKQLPYVLDQLPRWIDSALTPQPAPIKNNRSISIQRIFAIIFIALIATAQLFIDPELRASIPSSVWLGAGVISGWLWFKP